MRHLPLILLLACTNSGPPAAPNAAPLAAPVPPPQPTPAPTNKVFVRASTLNLRAEASPTSGSLGQLSINSALTRIGQQGDWIKVRVGNGKEGWVGAAFVAPELLTLDEAIRQATTNPTDALSWWQRAAAIDTTRPVLQGLLAAYQAAGDKVNAARVEKQLAWPHNLLLAWQPIHPKPGQTVVEWSSAGFEEPARRTIPKAGWKRYGLDPTDHWYVLPSIGPAIPAEAVRMSTDPLNDCSGEWSQNVLLKHKPLPDGVVALVAARGRPPASWSDATRPAVTRAQAMQQLMPTLKKLLSGSIEIELAAAGSNWKGLARTETGTYGEMGNTIYDSLELTWTPEGVVLGDVQRGAADTRLVGERDVLGSGSPLQIRRDFCTTMATDAEGMMRQATGERCCGC